ncbi:MAG: hypothetical protein KKD39_00225 [Candidatus Altiarchaeota archaeon]|nr:hypothetical protein [Candidatus Altiarchaeota archaeon]
MKHGRHYKQGGRPPHVMTESLRMQQQARAELTERDGPRINEHVELMPARKKDKAELK